MNSIHPEKSDRILSEENRDNLYRTSSVIRFGFIGAFIAFTLFAILNLFNLGNVIVYFGSTAIDPEAVWAFLGAVVGFVTGFIITSFSNKY